MNDKPDPVEGTEEHTEKHVQHAILHVATKLAPPGLAALFSSVGSTAVDFFADLNRRVERLDHQCPITEQRVTVLEGLVVELRTAFARYPRDYELQRAIQGHEALLDYSGTDRILVERLVKDVSELQVQFRQLLKEHNANQVKCLLMRQARLFAYLSAY